MDNQRLLIVIYAVIALLIGAFILGFNRGQQTAIKTASTEGSVVKIVKKAVHDTLYIPKPLPSETVFVPVPADVDTADILQKFFSYRVYVDTVSAGEYVDFKITDSIAFNELLSHKIEILSVPELYVPPGAVSTRCVALGALTGKNIMALKVDLGIKRHTFSAGYDFNQRTPIVSYSYKLLQW